MKRVLIFTALLAVACLGFGNIAKADSVGSLTLTGCGVSGSGCPDATYSFDIGNTSATLTILITGTVNADNNLITGVNLGLGSNITLLSVTGPNAGWQFGTGSVNSSSNCTNSDASFICAFGSVGITSGGSYTWTWTYNSINADAIDPSGVHIGANYDPHEGFIVSQAGAGSVPEPASLTLLGFGLLGMPFLRRRRS